MQNAKKGDSSRQQLTLSNSLVEAAAWPSNDCLSVSVCLPVPLSLIFARK